MRLLILGMVTLAAITAMALPGVAQTTDSKSIREKQVRSFMAAFNAHNTKQMLEFTEDDFQWLEVNDAKVAVHTHGKKALQESMERYFRSCPTCKSSLEWVKHTGERLVALEIATWKDKKGEQKSIRSLSVYEFRNSKIWRVFYFPDEFDAPKITALVHK